MERHFEHDLDGIRQTLLRMGAMVEQMVAGSLDSLVQRDDDRAEAIVREDEEVDELEKEVDERCHRILATQQPIAKDLRFLVSVMSITKDLERVGDSAVNISRSVLVLNQEPPLGPYRDLPALAEMVAQMVRDALDSFVNRDSREALEVCRRDKEADAIYKRVFQELLDAMVERHEAVNRALHLVLIARNLERIGDHATNIAEDVIYYVEGRDIRHERLAPVDPAAN
ncbi:MAG: phosphate signaling complex protein PhoU [Thermoanaerobaculia bacterium]